jgi:hypothetical protein
MSDSADFWSDVFDWFTDRLAFRWGSPLSRQAPKIEATDGHEPTLASTREEARQADAKLRLKSKTLSSVDKKALDKEFWDVM